MTRRTPLLRITLQCSQIFLTLARTFMVLIFVVRNACEWRLQGSKADDDAAPGVESGRPNEHAQADTNVETEALDLFGWTCCQDATVMSLESIKLLRELLGHHGFQSSALLWR